MTVAERARGLRIAMLFGAFLAILVTEDGRTSHIIGGVVTAAALLLYWMERPGFFRLALLWSAAFLLIVTGEGLIDADKIRRSVAPGAYDEASRYMVAAHFLALLGRDLVFAENAVRPAGSIVELRLRTVLPILAVSTVAILAYFVPVAIRTYTSGRVGQDVQIASVGGALLQGFATSASVAVAITASWCARKSRELRTLLLALAIGIMTIQFLVAIRFLLLFTAVGSAIVWIAPTPPTRKVLAGLAGLALVLVMASTVMGKTRTFGVGESDVGGVVEEMGVDDFVFKEGVVQTMSLAVTYTRIQGFTNGSSSAAVLVFWIPRTLWPGKPTMTGYWLPRFFTTRGFSAGFSAAQGFAGNAYLDFGFWGGLATWFVFGLLFGLVERAVARVCATDGDARVIVVAPLFGGAFFAVRSVDTTALVLVGVLLYLMSILVFSGRRRAVPTAEHSR